MCTKMPYLKEDEIVINGKTMSSTAADVDAADESYIDNKVSLFKPILCAK